MSTKDMLGVEIDEGDLVAYGVREGNVGRTALATVLTLDPFRVVRKGGKQPSQPMLSKVVVIESEYDKDTEV